MAAPIVFKNAYVELNGVNLSANVKQVQLNYQAASLQATAMGDASQIRKGGVLDWSADVTFHQLFSCVDATLFALVGCQACMELRAQNICASSCTNPRFNGTVMVQSYPPFGGAHGVLIEAVVKLESAGDLSRMASSTA